MIDRLLTLLGEAHADFVEARYQRRISRGIQADDGKIEASGAGHTEGVGIRVLKDGSWGFSSTTKTDIRALRSAVRDARALASASKPSKQRRIEITEAQGTRTSTKPVVKKRVSEADFTDLTSMVLEAHSRIRSQSSRIVSDQIGLSLLEEEKHYLNTEGAEIHIADSKVFARVSCTAREAGTLAPAFESQGGTAGLEFLDDHPLNEMAEKATDRADRLLQARLPRGGEATVILHPGIVGMLAHEAIGHMAEADFVESGSALAGKTGERVSSDLITLFDDALLEGAIGWVPFDDEGTPGERTVIIEKGILRGYLHSRESAKSFNVKPTGNARAWSFEYDPIIRMRNTCIAPGTADPEEIIHGTSGGYLLIGGMSGQADSNGEFMFGVQEARRILKGELQETLRGVTISGNIFQALNSVDAVGRDFEVQSGTCGKEQPVWVGIGGPHLRMKALIGGSTT